ncbi:MAG: AEC family transporter [Cellvibrionaceae bacterium]
MAVIFAIIPVFLIILCGYLCRRYQFPDENFWRGAEKITYFLLFPALLVSKMATASLDGIDFLKPAIVILVLLLSISVLLLLCKPIMQIRNAAFTSVYQGGIRFNTYIGLAVVFALHGSQGLVVAVVIASMMIPLINILSVLVLEYYGNSDSQQSNKSVIKSVISNPLILACVIGMGINLSGVVLPNVLVETLNIFSRAALPLGLLTVGAALTLQSIQSSTKPLLIASFFKFLLLPMMALGLCVLLEVEPMVRNAIVILTSLPTATASYVLSRQLGGDHELMATIITGQTLLAGIVMPLILLLATPL